MTLYSHRIKTALCHVHFTLLLKLLTPSPYSLLDHGRVHWYDRINFSISSHVFIEPQQWIKSSATITGWFSVLRSQKRHPLHATNEYRKWSLFRMISCWKNPLLTELFDDVILRLTFLYLMSFYDFKMWSFQTLHGKIGENYTTKRIQKLKIRIRIEIFIYHPLAIQQFTISDSILIAFTGMFCMYVTFFRVSEFLHKFNLSDKIWKIFSSIRRCKCGS